MTGGSVNAMTARRQSRLRLSGERTAPLGMANTRSPSPRRPIPRARRSSLWRSRCTREASTADPGKVINLRPCRDFGAFTRSPAVSSTLRSTRTAGASKSASLHRSARSSPRRIPVPRAKATIGRRAWPSSRASTSLIWAPERAWISCASTLGGRSTVAALRPTISTFAARARTACRIRRACPTVLAEERGRPPLPPARRSWVCHFLEAHRAKLLQQGGAKVRDNLLLGELPVSLGRRGREAIGAVQASAEVRGQGDPGRIDGRSVVELGEHSD